MTNDNGMAITAAISAAGTGYGISIIDIPLAVYLRHDSLIVDALATVAGRPDAAYKRYVQYRWSFADLADTSGFTGYLARLRQTLSWSEWNDAVTGLQGVAAPAQPYTIALFDTIAQALGFGSYNDDAYPPKLTAWTPLAGAAFDNPHLAFVQANKDYFQVQRVRAELIQTQLAYQAQPQDESNPVLLGAYRWSDYVEASWFANQGVETPVWLTGVKTLEEWRLIVRDLNACGQAATAYVQNGLDAVAKTIGFGSQAEVIAYVKSNANWS